MFFGGTMESLQVVIFISAILNLVSVTITTRPTLYNSPRTIENDYDPGLGVLDQFNKKFWQTRNQVNPYVTHISNPNPLPYRRSPQIIENYNPGLSILDQFNKKFWPYRRQANAPEAYAFYQQPISYIRPRIIGKDYNTGLKYNKKYWKSKKAFLRFLRDNPDLKLNVLKRLNPKFGPIRQFNKYILKDLKKKSSEVNIPHALDINNDIVESDSTDEPSPLENEVEKVNENENGQDFGDINPEVESPQVGTEAPEIDKHEVENGNDNYGPLSQDENKQEHDKDTGDGNKEIPLRRIFLGDNHGVEYIDKHKPGQSLINDDSSSHSEVVKDDGIKNDEKDSIYNNLPNLGSRRDNANLDYFYKYKYNNPPSILKTLVKHNYVPVLRTKKTHIVVAGANHPGNHQNIEFGQQNWPLWHWNFDNDNGIRNQILSTTYHIQHSKQTHSLPDEEIRFVLPEIQNNRFKNRLPPKYFQLHGNQPSHGKYGQSNLMPYLRQIPMPEEYRFDEDSNDIVEFPYTQYDSYQPKSNYEEPIIQGSSFKINDNPPQAILEYLPPVRDPNRDDNNANLLQFDDNNSQSPVEVRYLTEKNNDDRFKTIVHLVKNQNSQKLKLRNMNDKDIDKNEVRLARFVIKHYIPEDIKYLIEYGKTKEDNEKAHMAISNYKIITHAFVDFIHYSNPLAGYIQSLKIIAENKQPKYTIDVTNQEDFNEEVPKTIDEESEPVSVYNDVKPLFEEVKDINNSNDNNLLDKDSDIDVLEPEVNKDIAPVSFDETDVIDDAPSNLENYRNEPDLETTTLNQDSEIEPSEMKKEDNVSSLLLQDIKSLANVPNEDDKEKVKTEFQKFKDNLHIHKKINDTFCDTLDAKQSTYVMEDILVEIVGDLLKHYGYDRNIIKIAENAIDRNLYRQKEGQDCFYYR